MPQNSIIMIKLNIQDETSRLRAVVLGIAESSGPVPKIEDAYDPKSIEHITLGTYPAEDDMVVEMAALNKVFEKYNVKVYRPNIIENYNQIFSRDIAFVVEDIAISAYPSGFIIIENNWIRIGNRPQIGPTNSGPINVPNRSH